VLVRRRFAVVFPVNRGIPHPYAGSLPSVFSKKLRSGSSFVWFADRLAGQALHTHSAVEVLRGHPFGSFPYIPQHPPSSWTTEAVNEFTVDVEFSATVAGKT
jgi:hypothetical protein